MVPSTVTPGDYVLSLRCVFVAAAGWLTGFSAGAGAGAVLVPVPVLLLIVAVAGGDWWRAS